MLSLFVFQIFKELVDELKDTIKAEKSKAEVSAKGGRNVEKDSADSEWLSGTNVNVTKVGVGGDLLVASLHLIL